MGTDLLGARNELDRAQEMLNSILCYVSDPQVANTLLEVKATIDSASGHLDTGIMHVEEVKETINKLASSMNCY